MMMVTDANIKYMSIFPLQIAQKTYYNIVLGIGLIWLSGRVGSRIEMNL